MGLWRYVLGEARRGSQASVLVRALIAECCGVIAGLISATRLYDFDRDAPRALDPGLLVLTGNGCLALYASGQQFVPKHSSMKADGREFPFSRGGRAVSGQGCPETAGHVTLEGIKRYLD